MILHICCADKFIPDFIKFVQTHFDENDHVFIIFGGDLKKYPIASSFNTWHCNNRTEIFKMMIVMQSADKIIIHGLFDNRLVRLLTIMPWLLKKCYWVMWGGDLYHYQLRARGLRSNLNELVRTFVIRRFGHFITHIKGDYELAKEWYGASGQWHECFMYPSNLYKDYPLQTKVHDIINIQVGNSADPSNNHLEVLEKLKSFRDQAIRIYVPLSYGDLQYAETIISYGIENFGEKFVPLTDFMPFDKYLDLLAQIDIAIFNHRRQQGMGNTTTLLGLGKKVYIRNDVTPWHFYAKLGVALYDVAEFNVDLIANDVAQKNEQIVSCYFSTEKLKHQLKEFFQ